MSPRSSQADSPVARAEKAAAKKAALAAKKQANRQRKRGSNMSLEEAQRTGYKTFVSLKGDATQKQAKKGWLNPFSDE